MRARRIPADIVVRMFTVFRKGFRKNNEAALHSMERFAAYIESGRLSPEDARQALLPANDATISAFIEETRGYLSDADKKADKEFKDDILNQTSKLLDGIKANGTALGEIRTEIEQLKTTVSDLKNTSREISDTSKEISNKTKEISNVTNRLTTITRALVNGVRKAVYNTSTAVGRRVGIEAGIASSLIMTVAIGVATSLPLGTLWDTIQPQEPPIKHEDFNLCEASKFSLPDLSASKFNSPRDLRVPEIANANFAPKEAQTIMLNRRFPASGHKFG